MSIHPDMASKFHLLEGISSFQQFLEDPAVADRRKAFDGHPGYDAPAWATRMEETPGPHGPVPVRIYTPDQAGNAPCLVWMHGGAFISGDLDMPEAGWVARELASRAGIVVISVDYRLCTDGVTYPVPHDDVVAAIRWVRQNAHSLGVDADRLSIGGAGQRRPRPHRRDRRRGEATNSRMTVPEGGQTGTGLGADPAPGTCNGDAHGEATAFK